jgi:hypothetical protein
MVIQMLWLIRTHPHNCHSLNVRLEAGGVVLSSCLFSHDVYQFESLQVAELEGYWRKLRVNAYY